MAQDNPTANGPMSSPRPDPRDWSSPSIKIAATITPQSSEVACRDELHPPVSKSFACLKPLKNYWEAPGCSKGKQRISGSETRNPVPPQRWGQPTLSIPNSWGSLSTLPPSDANRPELLLPNSKSWFSLGGDTGCLLRTRVAGQTYCNIWVYF